MNDKERRNRDEGHFFRRNYMYIIWFLKKIVSIGIFIEEI